MNVRATGEWRDEEGVREEDLVNTDMGDIPTDSELDSEAAADPNVDPNDTTTATDDAFQETKVQIGEGILVALGVREEGGIRIIVDFQPLMVISPTASWIRWCMQVYAW